MRFLLDTNVLIPLENSQVVLEDSLAHFVRLANEHGHQLVYHPASEDDISRDTDSVRRGQRALRTRQHQDRFPDSSSNSDFNLERFKKYFSRAVGGFLGLSEALAKEHACNGL